MSSPADADGSPTRLSITGGTGFIGSRLAQRCLQLGRDVAVLGQENTDAERDNALRLRKAGAAVHLGSVTDRRAVADCLEGSRLVIHLAAAQHEMSIPDATFRDVNVEGTRIVLQEAAKANVGRVVHGSTIGVYGAAEGRIDEEAACNPTDVYGQTKLEAEGVASEADVPATIVRIPETYGPGDRRLLKLFRALRKGSFVSIGRGRNLHDLLFVDDLVDGLLLAGATDTGSGEVYLFGGPDPLTTDEMIAAIAAAVDARPPRVRVPLWPLLAIGTVMELTLRPLGIQPPLHRRRLNFFRRSFELNTEKARTVLGFEPRRSFAEGARATADWYREEGMLR